ncbi:Acg family FMN-binding oxidoreductase [Amycolatopsis magusensis]|uniref:Acg family FMN-binding oxidoreductase n=1 Tax=Amycolatopsis magusensis TaxID=882444 RepID=UPI0024A93F21|nr:nitroreductase family protein [Amycolatopsis magusensis]MDI5975911.1 nitroreductase family protein [Amycolatopsis magusensis]
MRLTSVGRLGADQVESVLRAAVLAPSTHNTQPWLFRCTPGGIELHADVSRVLPATDPDQRELLLSCGAALFNLRTAIHALGTHPATVLRPRRDEPTLLAVVRPFAAHAADARYSVLAKAIPHRHTNRHPFRAARVPPAVIANLRHAAEAEHAWMPVLDSPQRERLRGLVEQAHEAQLADSAFLAEWRQWTGRANHSRDGVPARAAGNDNWALRDFGEATGPQGHGGPPGEPFIVVLGSFGDDPIDRLRAGQAMQRLLLTATAAGLDASFISQPVEVPSARRELRQLLGGGLWPQMVLRVGYGSPATWTPRRPLAEVLLDDRLLSA